MSYYSKDTLYYEDFKYIIEHSNGTHARSICPFCNAIRTNKTNKCLSIDRKTLVYHCHYCNASGKLKSKMGETLAKEQRYYQPEPKVFRKPKKQETNVVKEFDDNFIAFFKKRCISLETLKEAKVTEDIHYIGDFKAKKRCVAFNYYLEDELINVKYRTSDKHFALEAGAQNIPYNINSIAEDAYEEGEERSCFFVEGEMDALTYIECGYKHVVSVPTGANNHFDYLDDFIDSHFDKLDWIYISVDNDKKGTELKYDLLRRFGKEKCRIVEYPKPCKDINEVLMQYGKEEVDKCVKNYIELKPDGVQELVDVENNLDFIFNNGLQKGSMVGIPSVDKILSFKTGMLCVVTGIPSHGKTYMLNYLLARLNILHDWRMAFFSPEFYPVSLHIAQVLETMGGLRFNSQNYNKQTYEVMKEYLCKNFYWIDPDDTDINSVMERARYLIKKKGIKALVIDPFNALTDKEKKSQKQDEYISEFLQKLRWFARKYDIAVFLVMHPTKMLKLENGLYPVCDLYNCKGASEIFDKADIGLTVWRNEIDDYAELHVTKIKFRHLGEKGHATFKFNINNGRYVEIGDADDLKHSGQDIRTMSVNWDNSNYILDKVKGNQIQQELPTQEDTYTIAPQQTNDPFEFPNETTAPF